MDVEPPKFRRTRIVCISDTHNQTPSLPAGDILIHAGDLTTRGTYSELKHATEWLVRQKFEAKVIIAGNHDVTLDSEFYKEHGSHLHGTNDQSSQKCIALLTENKSLIYLNHESVTVRLSSEAGPRTICTIFGSPFSPAKGIWAFGYQPDRAESLWNDVPLATDILVTHTPPRYHLDETAGEPRGCPTLREALWRVRPRLHVCGHVHEGRGAERVKWDLESQHTRFKEKATHTWTDKSVGTKKVAKIDLTLPVSAESSGFDGTCDPSFHAAFTGSSSASFEAESVKADAEKSLILLGSSLFVRGSIGDTSALEGRLDRDETCIVNAAIMAESWNTGRKKSERATNKPIVVDIYLPVWM